MCGRFTLLDRLNALLDQFAVEANDAPLPLFEGRYNIPPTLDIPIIKFDGKRQLSNARWGLIPSWTKEGTNPPMLNNARAETIKEKPSFRSAYKKRRCIIPASGFYEWQDNTKPKQPYYFHSTDSKMLAFAGIWASWHNIESCSIVTTEANNVMAPVHHRMPVILGANDYDLWLNPELGDATHLMAPCPDSEITCYPVSTYVNKVANQGEKCIERMNTQSDFLFN